MNIAAIFFQTLNVTLPVFAMVFVGIAMRRADWIDDRFVSAASKIVFKGSMPALIFVSIVGADFAGIASWLGLAYFIGLCVFFYKSMLRK